MKPFFREYVQAILVAVLLALGVRAYVVGAYEIPSESMVPTFLVGDRLMVDKTAFKFRKPQRDEVIVFDDPAEPGRNLIKRIIGLPGETIELRNKVVYINGAPLDEPFALHDAFDQFRLPMRDDFGPLTIPAGHYFMMGDNRENSKDSRWWGFLDEKLIVGKAFVIYWSRDQQAAFPAGIRFGRFALLVQ